MSKAHKQLFKQLIKLTQDQNLLKGKALHGLLIKTQSLTNLYLANAIINLYTKCGQLNKANIAFNQIPIKDNVSWSSIINANAKLGGPTSYFHVMNLFQQLMVEGFLPSGHCLVGVFSALSTKGDVLVGTQVHCLSVKMGLCSDVVVGSAVVNVYCKCGWLCYARQVFDEMSERNSVSWATMLSGYSSFGMVDDSVGLFKLIMCDEVERGNQFLLTSVLSAVTLPEFLCVGKGVHCFGFKVGVMGIGEVRNALVTMYLKCGSPVDALKLFELSRNKNPIMWSAMVTGFAQSGYSKDALELFDKMHSSGVSPSEYTFVGVINACSDIGANKEGKQVHCYLIKIGFESQMYIITALVDMYAKCSSIDDARKGFDYLQEPDVVLWTSMMGGYVQNGNNEEALSMYARMEAKGIEPNDLTITNILKACSSLAALEQGKQVHAQAIKHGLGKRIEIGSALSTMYAKCGCIDDCNVIFRRISNRDVVSWNAMISGLAQNGCSHKAIDLFDEMRLEGVNPDNVTFVNLLSACSHIGLVERAWDYFKAMTNDFNIVPGLEHYACMVDVYSRAGRLNEAKEFIESAPIDHGMCLWRILLSASRNHRHYELGAYAGEKLMELGSQESSAYVLLSRIYMALGKSDDAERVMRLMKLRRVDKEPGCSWIDIKNLVHVFFVGDQKHPEIDNVYCWLRILTKQMMDEGYRPAYDSFFTLSTWH